MSAHTPGPWSVAGPRDEAGNHKVEDAAGCWVARVHFRNPTADGSHEAEANANLIAAAPEMFRLLAAVSLAIDASLSSGKPIDPKRLVKLGTEIDAVRAKARGGQ